LVWRGWAWLPERRLQKDGQYFSSCSSYSIRLANFSPPCVLHRYVSVPFLPGGRAFHRGNICLFSVDAGFCGRSPAGSTALSSSTALLHSCMPAMNLVFAHGNGEMRRAAGSMAAAGKAPGGAAPYAVGSAAYATAGIRIACYSRLPSCAFCGLLPFPALLFSPVPSEFSFAHRQRGGTTYSGGRFVQRRRFGACRSWHSRAGRSFPYAGAVSGFPGQPRGRRRRALSGVSFFLDLARRDTKLCVYSAYHTVLRCSACTYLFFSLSGVLLLALPVYFSCLAPALACTLTFLVLLLCLAVFAPSCAVFSFIPYPGSALVARILPSPPGWRSLPTTAFALHAGRAAHFASHTTRRTAVPGDGVLLYHLRRRLRPLLDGQALKDVSGIEFPCCHADLALTFLPGRARDHVHWYSEPHGLTAFTIFFYYATTMR